MTVVDVTGVLGGCCQVTVALVKSSLLTAAVSIGQEGVPTYNGNMHQIIIEMCTVIQKYIMLLKRQLIFQKNTY